MNQTIKVSQHDRTQTIKFGSDVKFLKGEDGYSPTINVAEAEGGFNITVTDAEGSETFFVPSGNTITDEQIQEAVNVYLSEHPVKIEVADAVVEGDMRPVSSNAVYVEMSNITALMRTI